MFSKTYRFDFARVRGLFAPRKPRHPLLRLALGLVGVAVLCLLVVVGVFVGAAMIVGGLLFKLLRQRGQPVANSRVVEGEYRVLRKPVLPLSR
ncbi:hypothetical protein J5837_08365 [Pseudoxanthomonas helianthi]|uniref:Transmembrane protein n=1 Tax=Pseudoxanthomonas helianthi TaxID=1453541 RepID=A0A940X3G1_9GAMM|nr:hypothetical protein [Pseudoxanthomonas helianthi]MBP3984442.1 hypothetical protein [Pseudoxanthomonas helianthi]